ncbi:MAG TPA: FAD-dependent oxidoreductase [Nitrospiraceae bacterium]|nr:FAD-dependent oxidoreductase [Nitrospiraceae bacterium]
MNKTKPTVLIIGGGAAGVTAALALSERGFAVTLCEQRGRLGGRLIDCLDGEQSAGGPIPPEPAPILLLGCQTATWNLLDRCGTAPLIRSTPTVGFELLFAADRRMRFPRLWAPGPWHTLGGVALFTALSFRDRWRLLSFLERTWEGAPPLPQNLELQTADAWLEETGQSQTARATVWNPLSRFLLGDDLKTVSAAMFATMLKRCFLSRQRDSAVTIPPTDAEHWLLAPLRARLLRTGVTLRLNSAAARLVFDDDRVAAVHLHNGETLTADWYIAALPHSALSALIPERIVTHFAYFQQLAHLTDSSALTVHLRFEGRLRSPRLVLLAGRTFHWIVSRPLSESQEEGVWVSTVAVGTAEALERADSELIQIAQRDAVDALPALVAASMSTARVSRKPRAWLSLRPGTRAMRPLPRSPFANLLVAGDWTDTGWPASLESAIVSGERCAEAIVWNASAPAARQYGERLTADH